MPLLFLFLLENNNKKLPQNCYKNKEKPNLNKYSEKYIFILICLVQKIEEKILLDFQKTKRGKLDALVNIVLKNENKSDQII